MLTIHFIFETNSYISKVSERNKLTPSKRMLTFTSHLRTMLLMAITCTAFLSLPAIAESTSETSQQSSDSDLKSLLDLSFKDLLALDVVYSAGFFAMERKRSPGNSFILSLDKIENSPGRTLSDLIDMNVIGMDIGEHRFNSTLIGVRGIMIDNNAKTLVMLDSWQLNQRQHMGYMLPAKNPLIGDIQSIEFIMGPGAIVHGSGAVNGFINMISKTGSTNEGFEVDLEYGTEEKYRGLEVSYGKSWGYRKDFYIYAGIQGADGFTPDNQYNISAISNYNHGDLKTKKMYDSNYKISTNFTYNNFSMKALHIIYDEETSHWVYAPLAWANTPRRFSFAGVNPKYIYEISENNSIEFVGAVEYSDFGGRNIVDPSDVHSLGTRENHFEGKVVYKKSNRNNTLAVGALWGEREFENGKTYFIDTPRLPNGTDDAVTGSWEETALFFEDTLTIGNKTTLSLGLRYDNVSYGKDIEAGGLSELDFEDQSNVTPRIAIAYDINDTSTIKFSYQEGFRYPDMAYYTWWIQFNDILEAGGYSLPALEPETMSSFEIGYYNELNEDDLTLTANLYYNVYKDQLTWHFFDRDGPYVSPEAYDYVLGEAGWFGSFINQHEDMSVIGAELMINWKIQEDHAVSLGIGKVKLNDFPEERFPPLQVKTNIVSTLLNNKLSLTLNHHYNSGLSSNGFENMHDDYKDARSVFNGSAKYLFSNYLSAKLVIKNILENDTPKYSFELDSPWTANAGNNHRYIYLSLNYTTF
ncbi:MAG: hypothetical protein COA99_07815 [Moraxellaceae bacterium]|nr:MAG: hypothetical protein COA99_07815 [Moraxellaceae bacterium]